MADFATHDDHGTHEPSNRQHVAESPGAMHAGWDIPTSLLGPPVVNPAIHGIDQSDVGGEVGPIQAYVGVGGGPAGQARSRSRTELVDSADGGRAHAMGAELEIAAQQIAAQATRIVHLLNSPAGERGPDGVLEEVRAAFREATEQRTTIVAVFHEKPTDKGVRASLLYLARADKLLTDASQKAASYASEHKLPADGLVASGVEHDVGLLTKTMNVEDTEYSRHKIGDLDPVAKLQVHAVTESLDALADGMQALVMAVNEASPGVAVDHVLPTLSSSLRMLEFSMTADVRPPSKLVGRLAKIQADMDKAWRDAGPLGLQTKSDFRIVHDELPRTLQLFRDLSKGKAK